MAIIHNHASLCRILRIHLTLVHARAQIRAQSDALESSTEIGCFNTSRLFVSILTFKRFKNVLDWPVLVG